jgi:hypothetical protein
MVGIDVYLQIVENLQRSDCFQERNVGALDSCDSRLPPLYIYLFQDYLYMESESFGGITLITSEAFLLLLHLSYLPYWHLRQS